MSRDGRNDIIESEWVYTGAGFALSHPVAQHLGAVWLVVLWVALHAGLCVLGLLSADLLGGLQLSLLVFLLLSDIFAILTLIGRHPLARYPVWICLIFSFPFSLPLVMYWADGLRPNLIYRHRFSRLVFPESEARP